MIRRFPPPRIDRTWTNASDFDTCTLVAALSYFFLESVATCAFGQQDEAVAGPEGAVAHEQQNYGFAILCCLYHYLLIKIGTGLRHSFELGAHSSFECPK